MEDQVMDVQDGLTEDFFESYQLVDDAGNAVFENPQGENSENTPAPAPQQPAPQEQGAQSAGAAQQPQSQAANGFLSNFMKPGETGEPALDTEQLYGFLFNPESPGFAYQPPAQPQGQQQQAAGQQQQPQAGQPPREEIPPWKEPFIERQNYENEQLERLLYPIKVAREQLGQNMDPRTKEFLDWQEQNAKDYVRNEMIPKWEYERNEQREKERFEQQQSKQKLAEYQAKSNANLNALAQRVGGDDKLNQFLFGKVENGKLAFKGYGADVAQQLFADMRPDARNMSGQQYSEAFKSWWTEYTADSNRLNMIYDIALAKFQRENWDTLVDKIGAKAQQTMQQNFRAGQQRGGGMKAPVSVGGNNPQSFGHPDIDTFIYGRDINETV